VSTPVAPGGRGGPGPPTSQSVFETLWQFRCVRPVSEGLLVNQLGEGGRIPAQSGKPFTRPPACGKLPLLVPRPTSSICLIPSRFHGIIPCDQATLACLGKFPRGCASLVMVERSRSHDLASRTAFFRPCLDQLRLATLPSYRLFAESRVHRTYPRRLLLSHIVTVQSKIKRSRDPCRLSPSGTCNTGPRQGHAFQRANQRLLLQLPGWTYPAVIDTASGK